MRREPSPFFTGVRNAALPALAFWGFVAWGCRACMVLACLVAPAAAQGPAKPVGAYGPQGAPGWVTFGTLASSVGAAELEAARARSVATGFAWIVQAGFDVAPHVYAEGPAREMRARFEAAGLWPHVIAVTWGEEWYERCHGGEFAAAYGVAGPTCASGVYDWMSAQHEALARVTAKPVLWVTHVADRQWRRVPSHTSYVAVDAYPADGQPWADHLPTLLHSEGGTDLPLVVVPRWFRTTGPAQGAGWAATSAAPTAWAEGYAALLRRPRWVAMLGFLWASRPWADLTGLADMPDTRAAVERALLGLRTPEVLGGR